MRLPILSLFVLIRLAVISRAEAPSPADSVNSFGLDLYRKEPAGETANVLLSPYSLHTALTMAAAGAGGTTRDEMTRVLLLIGKGDEAVERIASLRAGLEKSVADSQKRAEAEKKNGGHIEPLQFHVANRLFGLEGYPFHGAFLKRTESLWKSPLETVPFSANPEGARKRINNWVEEQTEKRIVDLVPKGGVDASTRIALVNALYFKGAWEKPFQTGATKPLPFFAGGKSSVNVPTMYRQNKFGYVKEPGYAVVTIPYVGRDFHFLIILPDDRAGLLRTERSLTGQQLAKFANLPADREVQLYLPKFKLAAPTLPLANCLKSMGMNAAFLNKPDGADFSRMAPRSPADYLVLSEVFHKTFMSLDEKGTEAAAATALAVSFGAALEREKPKPVEFRADHPFLFAIQHSKSGVCLFLGRLNDPR